MQRGAATSAGHALTPRCGQSWPDPVHERAGRVDAEVCPGEVRAFAEAMLAEVRWRPDPILMLDLCEPSDRLWLVEINGFSNSWLYPCDLPAVVAEASRLAALEWERAKSAMDGGVT